MHRRAFLTATATGALSTLTACSNFNSTPTPSLAPIATSSYTPEPLRTDLYIGSPVVVPLEGPTTWTFFLDGDGERTTRTVDIENEGYSGCM